MNNVKHFDAGTYKGAFGSVPIKKSIDKTVIKQRALKRIIKNEKVHFIKAKALSDLCEKPKKGEQYRIITEKQFNAYALILHVLESELIAELYLAIYRINEPTVNSITNFIEAGKIKQSVFIISNYFNQTKKPEVWANKLRDFCAVHDNAKCVFTHNHSKILALKTVENQHYIFEGSGNMSDNARIEQYLYENNKEVFDFHKTWMLELWQEENLNRMK